MTTNHVRNVIACDANIRRDTQCHDAGAANGITTAAACHITSVPLGFVLVEGFVTYATQDTLLPLRDCAIVSEENKKMPFGALYCIVHNFWANMSVLIQPLHLEIDILTSDFHELESGMVGV